MGDPGRGEQIENGIINGLIGVGVVAAGIIVTAAAEFLNFFFTY
ncbi:hypothetical protein ACW0TR_00880 [Fusobacterium polymorphum]